MKKKKYKDVVLQAIPYEEFAEALRLALSGEEPPRFIKCKYIDKKKIEKEQKEGKWRGVK